MTVQAPARSGVCNVLLEDSELAEALPSSRRDEVAASCVVREARIPPGVWNAGRELDGIGLLVMDGLLIRRVGIDGKFGAELLSHGDLLRPWQEEYDGLTLPLASTWTVHQQTRVAVLDERFARLLGRYPKLASRVVGRALRRSRHLAVNMAIVHQARVDTRLHMMLWHLAGRFGRVRGDGVIVPLRLTHAMLAELVAARRPTVSSALSGLAREGRVRLIENAWLLSGDPPGALGSIGGPQA
jgi:CRP/FNR family transcriptional regulator, cyclic AMP receptor protein